MPTKYLITLVIFNQFLFCGKKEKPILPENSIIAIHAQSAIIIDGILNEPAWQEAHSSYLKNSDSGDQVTDTTFATAVRTCYDDEKFYIAFVCHDRDIYSSFTERDQHLWEEEAVEVFIDVDDEPNTYVEIELSPNNVLFDSYIVDPVDIDIEATSQFNLPAITTAVAVEGTVNQRDDVDRKWMVEIAIPFVDLVPNFDFNMLRDAKWKINFYRIDRDHDGPTHYAWSPTKGRFHKPSAFGKLIFK